MAEQEFCQECPQKHDCQDIYRQVGSTKGPSVVWKVVVAFLLPLVVFIASLAVFQAILAKVVNTKQLQIAFSLLLALALTFVCVLIIKAVGRQFSKNR